MLLQQAGVNGLLQVLAGAMLGMFGGVGTTTLWGGWVRPARDRRNLARLLLAKIRMNRREVDWVLASHAANPDFLPLNLSLATATFGGRLAGRRRSPRGVAPCLGGDVRPLTRPQRGGRHLPSAAGRVRGAEGASARKTQLEAELHGRIDVLHGGLERCAAVDAVLPVLVRLARFRSEPPDRG